VGDEWQFWIKLKKPRGYSNPGGFDKEKYYFQNRLQAQGRVLLKLPARMKQQISTNVNCNPKKIASHWTSHPIHRLRAELLDKMKMVLADKTFGSLIIALVLGLREGITQEQWTVFRDTGTAHLMAISGLHVGLIASVVFWISQRVWRLLPQALLIIPAPFAAGIMAITAAIVYAVLAGFSIPTQRAVVMILLFMSAILTRRLGNIWKNYFIALEIVLLLDPFCSLSLGFWLSFGAVAMMIYGLKGRLQPKGLWWKWGRAQWVVFLGLMPLTLASFNQLSLISPIANMVAIPWVSFTVVPSALLGSVLLLFSEKLGEWLLAFSEICFYILWPLLNFLSKIPKANWNPAEFSSITLLLAFAGSIILLVPRGFPGRSIGLLGLLPLFLAKSMVPLKGAAKFTLLDVGQGLAAVIQTHNHVLVFDVGPKQGKSSDTGAQVVLPFLASQGIQKIDTLVISHGDNDHIGGLGSILQKIRVENIFTSEIEAVEKITHSISHSMLVVASLPSNFPSKMEFSNTAPNIKLCYAGQHWHWDGVDFEMLHPDITQTKKRNDHCCVLKVTAGKQSLLLTADIEINSEKKLLEKSQHKLASTLLVVPHHGSKTSSSLDFISVVNPSYAMIPVGYLNQYGHPKVEIVNRYLALNIPLLDSVQDGAISFVLTDQDRIEQPHSFRKQTQRFWHWDFKQ
jgi:competence protein ComEC